MSLAYLSQPVIRFGFRNDGDDPDAAIAKVVEDSDIADPKAKLWAAFACKPLDPGPGGIGRLMAQMALQPVADLGPDVGLQGSQVLNGLRGEQDLVAHRWLYYSHN